MASPRVCIVSSGCLSSGPRVEKEADALSDAGYDVTLLVCHTADWMAQWDAELARGKRWRYTALDWQVARRRRAPLWLASRGAQAVSRALSERIGARGVLADLACSDRALALWLRGRALHADLFIAHNLPALVVAAALARKAHAAYAFDAEDDHLGELPQTAEHALDAAIVDAVQARYLPRCRHVTAASDGIADALASRYRIARPTVVHNVFPWSLRERMDGQRRERRSAPGQGVSIYWYSQSLGLDRGLQDVLRAAGLLRGDFELHLRGHAPSSVKDELLALARSAGIAERVHFHPQVHPAELPSRTAEHDIGLALEQPVSENRLQAVTNKLFFYMLCGLALVATDTPGQRRIMASAQDAGFSYAPGDVAALAAGLQRFIDEPAALARARSAALEAARTTYRWELERERLVQRVRTSLAG